MSSILHNHSPAIYAIHLCSQANACTCWAFNKTLVKIVCTNLRRNCTMMVTGHHLGVTASDLLLAPLVTEAELPLLAMA